MNIGPDTLLNNGQLELYTFGSLGFIGTLRNIPRLYQGTQAKHPAVEYQRTGCIKVESETALGVAPDGELAGYLPATIEALPRALNMVMGTKPPVQ